MIHSTDLMREAEAAEMLLMSPKTLANMRSRRVGPPYTKLPNGAIRYSRHRVAAWVEAGAVNPGDAA